MKAIIIDDVRSIKADHLGLSDDDLKRVSLCSSTRKIAETAADLVELGDIVFINLDLKLENGFRQCLNGVAVLTWLRVKDVPNHCVLYSFRPGDQIASLRQQNLIIFAEGASLFQFPYDLQKLKIHDLSRRTARKENLKSYLLASFRIGEFRHRDANWWGVKALWDVHRIAGLHSFTEDYPDKVGAELKNLNSAVADYLYRFRAPEIENALKRPAAVRVRNDNRMAAMSIEDLRESLSLKPVGAPVSVPQVNEVQEIFDSSINAWDTWSKNIDRSPKRAILVIDDRANDGWMRIYKAIFGHKFLFPQPIVPSKADSIDQIYSAGKDSIKANQPCLIFLDLRLRDEIGSSVDLEHLSGFEILKRLRREFVGIPILMTTGSNKAWTIEKVLKVGADAYFMKDSPDGERRSSDIANNYRKLIELVEVLTSAKYKTLMEFANYAKRFRDRDGAMWNERGTWLNGDDIDAKVDEIARTLDDSVLVMKNYLHDFELGYSFGDDLERSFILSGLINKIAGVFELIHGMPDELGSKDYQEFRRRIEDRGDLNLIEVREFRNKYSHGRKMVSWQIVDSVIRAVRTYLGTRFEFQTVDALIREAVLGNDKLILKLQGYPHQFLNFGRRRLRDGAEKTLDARAFEKEFGLDYARINIISNNSNSVLLARDYTDSLTSDILSKYSA
jgi:CheY-like chemotaxis protein